MIYTAHMSISLLYFPKTDRFIKKYFDANGHPFRCYYCGVWLETSGAHRWTMDHMRPRSKGGDDSPSNLVQCCMYCNNAKKAKSVKTWCNHPDLRRIQIWVDEMRLNELEYEVVVEDAQYHGDYTAEIIDYTITRMQEGNRS